METQASDPCTFARQSIAGGRHPAASANGTLPGTLSQGDLKPAPAASGGQAGFRLHGGLHQACVAQLALGSRGRSACRITNVDANTGRAIAR